MGAVIYGCGNAALYQGTEDCHGANKHNLDRRSEQWERK
jgi:hypothetical protein